MKWLTVDAMEALISLPPGYRFARLNHAEVAPLIGALQAWHPDISVGAGSVYLREDFYRHRVCLDGRVDKDIYAIQILFNNELVGAWVLERELDSLALYGHFLVLAPAHRGAKVAAMAMLGSENMGRSMGAAFLYCFATLKHPYAQKVLESAGYMLLGMLPGYNREEVSPGVVKRVYQAVYAKLLAREDEVHWPDPKNLTPKAGALYRALFPDRLRS
jgi:hypothetical protein